MHLGAFATAEEAALCVARSTEVQAAAQGAAAALTSEEALQQAHAKGLSLPFEVSRGGKDQHLGYFATAEEAALCVARSPEGQAAAQRAAAAPLTSEEEDQGRW